MVFERSRLKTEPIRLKLEGCFLAHRKSASLVLSENTALQRVSLEVHEFDSCFQPHFLRLVNDYLVLMLCVTIKTVSIYSQP